MVGENCRDGSDAHHPSSGIRDLAHLSRMSRRVDPAMSANIIDLTGAADTRAVMIALLRETWAHRASM